MDVHSVLSCFPAWCLMSCKYCSFFPIKPPNLKMLDCLIYYISYKHTSTTYHSVHTDWIMFQCYVISLKGLFYIFQSVTKAKLQMLADITLAYIYASPCARHDQ